MYGILKKTITVSLALLSVFYAFSATPVTPNASPEARKVLDYLYSTFGNKILSAQHGGQSEIDYVYSVTGLNPVVQGTDLIFVGSDNSNYTFAVNVWKRGAIPTIMWHWGAPSLGEGYEQSKGTIDVNRCFQTGTAEYTAMWNDLKSRADFLTRLRDAHVPVLWRPMHECSGGWFWWDKSGGELFKRLWTTMFNYFANDRGLNNLIWVLGYDGSPSASYNPGRQYYDIAGVDNYDYSTASHISTFTSLRSIVGADIPLCYHECGTPLDPAACRNDNAMWSWIMVWDRDILRAVSQSHLQYFYSHNEVLTLNEVNMGSGTTAAKGDVNNSGTVDIVDALMVAQYYVGLNPAGFIPANADVNCSGAIDIVDALTIAQRYVGLIGAWSC